VSDRGSAARSTRHSSPVSDRLLVAVAVVAVTAGVLLHETGAIRGIERDLVDTRFELRGAEDPPPDIVVVGIDDRTFDVEDEAWPFRRSLHAALIDALRRARARVIAYDVQFTEPTTRVEDSALIEAVARHGRVVLSTTETNERGESAVFGGEEVLGEIGARSGNANLPPDEGDVLRRLPYEFDGLETFAVQIVAAERGRLPARPSGSTPWIDYRGPPRTFAHFSFSDALRARPRDPRFAGNTVVVGATAPSLHDVHHTPTSGDTQMAGPEIQANAISTVRDGFPLRSTPSAMALALVVLMGLAPPMLSRSQSVRASIGLALFVLVAFLVLAQLAFLEGAVWPVAAPVAGWALGALGAIGARYATTVFERERMRDLFRRFVPEAVVDDALEQAGGAPRLGGVRLDGTVLFCDLRGFTTFAERRDPEQVIEVLNRYLKRMSDAILEHDGTLVSYMGDGIMAVFGAPVPRDDHADSALAAARAMLAALDDFNADLRREGLDGFKIGIGLHSGPMMSGNVGSERRLEYTAIGDTTNAAARLEAATRDTPQQLLLSESTRARLDHPPGDLVPVGEIEIRGRAEPISAWTIAGSAVTPEGPDRCEPSASVPGASAD
jgi:adenylate cyclase